MAELPPALLAYVIRCVGTPTHVEACHGTSSSVWRIALAHGDDVVLKQCRPGRAFEQERAALGRVAVLGDAVPRLVAHDAGLRALVLGVVPGEDAAVVTGERAEIWRAAGRLRAAFDRIDAGPPDPYPLADAIVVRFERLLPRAARWLAPEPIARVRAVIDPRPFAERTRRFCHRDFGPHNWRVDRGRPGWLGCFDFGHARADDPLVDLIRCCAPPWHDPQLRAAFVDGWGVSLDDGARACVEQLEWLHAVTTLVWGHEHREPTFVALGEAALARLA